MKLALLLVLTCCLIAGCSRHESAKPAAPSNVETSTVGVDRARLIGKWLRPDGGYVLEIRAATDDGKLDAGYFNPNPINVSEATWRRSDELGLVIFIELRDAGYPGATYRLTYRAASDTLTGAYHQPTHGETFAVEFQRQ